MVVSDSDTEDWFSGGGVPDMDSGGVPNVGSPDVDSGGVTDVETPSKVYLFRFLGFVLLVIVVC